MVLTAITDTVRSGLRARAELLPTLHAEGTDCYRLFHGATEGLPGCTLDRYGDLLLWQTFREPPDIDPAELLPALRELVADETGAALEVHYNARDKRQRANAGVDAIRATLAEDHTASELGLRYCIDAPAPGRDPFLYLDFRAARRWLRANAGGGSVLNAFAFTCGAGVASLAGGANSVTNLDFSQSALDVGRANAEANALPASAFECVCSDALPALRQYAGLPATTDRRRGRGGGGRGGGRGRGRAAEGAAPSYPRLKAREFDLVVLDPPTWTKSRFGTVDLVRDYQSIFKPSLLATRRGGAVLAVNHVHSVDQSEWLDALDRCATKAGRPLAEVSVLKPEADFPSPDGRHPLKMAVCRLAE